MCVCACMCMHVFTMAHVEARGQLCRLSSHYFGGILGTELRPSGFSRCLHQLGHRDDPNLQLHRDDPDLQLHRDGPDLQLQLGIQSPTSVTFRARGGVSNSRSFSVTQAAVSAPQAQNTPLSNRMGVETARKSISRFGTINGSQ